MPSAGPLGAENHRQRKETAVFNHFDDDVFLGPEATVSLHFESGPAEGDEVWDISYGEALERAERSAWARHAVRSSGFGALELPEDDETDSQDLRAAMRHAMALSWD
jgi:hypothetical protein